MSGFKHAPSSDPPPSSATSTYNAANSFLRTAATQVVDGDSGLGSSSLPVPPETGTSPGGGVHRRPTIASAHPPHHPHRVSAIYQATHPEEEDQHHPTDVLDVHTASMRRAARELLSATNMRSRQLVVDLQYQTRSSYMEHASDMISMGGMEQEDDEASWTETEFDDEHGASEVGGATSERLSMSENNKAPINLSEATPLLFVPTLDTISSVPGSDPKSRRRSHRPADSLSSILQQASAVAVVALLNIMISIPFGASYFPIGWRADGVEPSTSGDDASGVGVGDLNGIFPLPGKQALGIRMFLFATIMGQIAFTFASKFDNPIGLQMVENVPFLHALCKIVIQNQGYGKEALSTLFFLFGISSIIVGMTFYLLGHWKLGRVVYFFPNHVLVGCIGGIGVFIVVTAIEVTSDVTFTFDLDGLQGLVKHFHLLSVVLAFECVLRLLQHFTRDKNGNAKYPFLSPVYYCLITPLFYLGLAISGVSLEAASQQGYFFPSITTDNNDISGGTIWQDPHLWDIFRVIDLSTVSFTAVFQCTGTMIALAAFSLIHVPINIPAFAISTDVDTDMNAELIAHGYANALSGIFGGLQTYMTYSNSVLYAKSGGKGKISSLAVVVLTMLLFVIGPSIASYLPRCMAGTLLFHIGIDLVLEGVYDSYGKYDHLEYAGIWAIALVMTIWGMTAALIAGVIAALTTYAVQSINYQSPIRQIMTASTLRSSAWTRCLKSREILENEMTGRARILVFQLQGHLFFGNVAQLIETIKNVLVGSTEPPIVVIVDFTLVMGMDSSAAHAIAKLKKIIHRLFHVEVSIFVTGSGRGGFPCEYALSEALSPKAANQVAAAGLDYNELLITIDGSGRNGPEDKAPVSPVQPGTISISRGSSSVKATRKLTPKVDGRVCESLDDALRFAEDILIARVDSSLETSTDIMDIDYLSSIEMTIEDEMFYARKFLRELLPESDDMIKTIDTLLKSMKREEYKQDETLWETGAKSDSMKLLICGELLAIIDDTGATEVVQRGNIVGELGLVHGTARLTTLVCTSEKAVLYSLGKNDFQSLKKKKPSVASAIDGIAIRYLAHRVQHVNNRYFHTTLPV